MIAMRCFILLVISSAWASDVTYYLYTPASPETPYVVSNDDPSQLSGSEHFDANKDSIFLIHGWVDNYTSLFNTVVKSAIVYARDVNIIVVDWSPVANLDYIEVKNGIPAVGATIGAFINSYNSYYGTTGDQITLIGYSFGGHVVGLAGRNVISKVKHIIGVDPAGPLYIPLDSDRLLPTDGKNVQVIHSNTALWGYALPCGTIDFYPNGGGSQNGCDLDLFGSCSHARPYQYLAEAILGGEFVAKKCKNYMHYILHMCDGNQQALMGSLDPISATGTFYLYTNDKAPFAKN